MRFRVPGFKVQGSRFKVQGSGSTFRCSRFTNPNPNPNPEPGTLNLEP
jgi:hypothetical protein